MAQEVGPGLGQRSLLQ
ncbi:hypothetical protein NVA20_00090 [Marinobacter sp. PJ-38]|nr:hypothetical protein [Marinobacter panjinensis]MCR8913139.1 hypothetical protein [Marinobacter panjinensis]